MNLIEIALPNRGVGYTSEIIKWCQENIGPHTPLTQHRGFSWTIQASMDKILLILDREEDAMLFKMQWL